MRDPNVAGYKSPCTGKRYAWFPFREEPFILLLWLAHSHISVCCCKTHGYWRNVHNKQAEKSVHLAKGFAKRPSAWDKYSDGQGHLKDGGQQITDYQCENVNVCRRTEPFNKFMTRTSDLNCKWNGIRLQKTVSLFLRRRCSFFFNRTRSPRTHIYNCWFCMDARSAVKLQILSYSYTHHTLAFYWKSMKNLKREELRFQGTLIPRTGDPNWWPKKKIKHLYTFSRVNIQLRFEHCLLSFKHLRWLWL